MHKLHTRRVVLGLASAHDAREIKGKKDDARGRISHSPPGGSNLSPLPRACGADADDPMMLMRARR
jgi:hypothetical protein